MMRYVLYALLTLGLLLGAQVALHAQVSINETTIQLDDRKAEIKAFPNPASDHFSLTVKNAKVGAVVINNIIGKKIKQLPANSEHRYDIDALKPGLYIIHVLDEKDELLKALRIMKS